MFEVSVLHEAEEELNAAARFYEISKPGLGQIFLNEVTSCFHRRQDYPLVGKALFGDYRGCSIRQFPYSVVYRVERDNIFVLAIAHWSRRPGFWRTRK